MPLRDINAAIRTCGTTLGRSPTAIRASLIRPNGGPLVADRDIVKLVKKAPNANAPLAFKSPLSLPSKSVGSNGLAASADSSSSPLYASQLLHRARTLSSLSVPSVSREVVGQLTATQPLNGVAPGILGKKP